MSLLFADGFDYYSDVSQVWDSVGFMNSNTATNARNGAGRCAHGNNGNSSFLSKTLANVASFVMGYGMYSPSGYGGGTYVLWEVKDGSTNQIDIRASGGVLSVTRNGTQLGSTFSPPSGAAWHYWEIKATIASGTGGSVEVRFDGVVVFTVSGVNTQNGSNAWVNKFTVAGAQGNPDWDDTYILSQSGSYNNDYKGDVAVRGFMATGAGSHTDFTPNGAGTNYGCVNEIPPDDDTTYVSSATPGQIDSYAMADLPVGVSSVAAVIAMVRHRKDDAGTRVAHIYVKSDVSTSESPDLGVPGTYQYDSYILETDPHTSAPWAAVAVNAVEVGVKEVS